MYTVYLVSVWLHILAATVWIGGMLFLVLVVVPWLRAEGQSNAVVFLRQTGERFRNVGWTCFAVLFVTGMFNLWVRGVRITDFVRAEWLSSPYGKTVIVKLGLFAAVLLFSGAHDFVVGPRATALMSSDPRSTRAQAARRQASLLGRANVLLALVLVAAGIILVRGSSW